MADLEHEGKCQKLGSFIPAYEPMVNYLTSRGLARVHRIICDHYGIYGCMPDPYMDGGVANLKDLVLAIMYNRPYMNLLVEEAQELHNTVAIVISCLGKETIQCSIPKWLTVVDVSPNAIGVQFHCYIACEAVHYLLAMYDTVVPDFTLDNLLKVITYEIKQTRLKVKDESKTDETIFTLATSMYTAWQTAGTLDFVVLTNLHFTFQVWDLSEPSMDLQALVFKSNGLYTDLPWMRMDIARIRASTSASQQNPEAEVADGGEMKEDARVCADMLDDLLLMSASGDDA